MTSVGEVYKCEICGNVVEVKESGEGELVCCDQPMKKQQNSLWITDPCRHEQRKDSA